MKELILGAGNSKKKILSLGDTDTYQNPTTLDIDPDCNPDIIWDLEDRPLPFDDEEFDEIHAYEVLEHIGKQGDWRSFFEEFTEYHRILKPNGHLLGSVPRWNSPWAWGDPGHTRVIVPGTFSFLSQDMYKQAVGITTMSDYRHVWSGNFEVVYLNEVEESLYFILRKIDGTRL